MNQSTTVVDTRKLDSWKEIAAYFGKDVRTVRRWETDRGLPVHRVPGGGRTGVFAYTAELDHWLGERRLPEGEEDSAATHTQYSGEPGQRTSDDHLSPREDQLPSHSARLLQVYAPFRHPAGWSLLLLAVVFVGIAAAPFALRRAPRAGADPARPAITVPTPDAATRDLYLRGRYLWNQRTESSLSDAAHLFSQAIVRNPRYAPAYAGLGDTYLLLRQYGKMPDAEAYPRAYFASLKALEIDQTSPEAHRSYGFVLNFWMWNFTAAETEFKRAIELDPRDAQTHHWYATSLLAVGRPTEALREIELARQLQPDSVAILADRGFILRTLNPAEANTSLLELERTNPRFSSVHRYLALLRLDAGRYDEYLSEFQTYLELQHRSSEAMAVRRARFELDRHGSTAMFQSLAENFGRLAEGAGNPDAMDAATFYAKLNDREHTLRYLNLSCGRRESNFKAIGSDAAFTFLRGSSEFESLTMRSRTPLQAPAEPADPFTSLAAR